MMLINIVLLVLSILLFVGSFVFLRQFYFLKKAFDEIIIKMMQDHETVINANKHFVRELKNKLDDIGKIEKDINIVRANLKNLLEEYNNKIKSIKEIK